MRLTEPEHLAEIDRAVRPARWTTRTSARGTSTPTATGRGTRSTRRRASARRPADEAHAADRLSVRARGSAGDADAPVLRRGGRLLASRSTARCTCWWCTAPARRRHHPQGQGRPGRDRCRRPRCARSPRRPASTVALGVPLGVVAVPAAERPREDRALLVGRGRASAAVQRSTFKPNDEIAALEWVTIRRRARATSATSPTSRSSTRFAKLVDQGVTRTFAIIARPPRQGGRPQRLGRPGCHPAARAARRASRRPRSSTRHRGVRRPSGSCRRTAVRCVTHGRARSRATGIDVKRDDGISQDAWESGHDEVRARRRQARARRQDRGALQPRARAARHRARDRARDGHAARLVRCTDAAGLEPGAFSVVHLSADQPGVGHHRDRDARAQGLTHVVTRYAASRRTPSARHHSDRARSPPVYHPGGSSLRRDH